MNITKVAIVRVDGLNTKAAEDHVVVEAPVEIRVAFWTDNSWHTKPVSITMRTPGEDEALAIGFLKTEGIIEFCQIESVKTGFDSTVTVRLKANVQPDLGKLQRNFYATSSCGVCGKSSLDALDYSYQHLTWCDNLPPLSPDFITALPQRLSTSQSIFALTGGVHAAGLFDWVGNLLLYAEDVGRHNAVDKIAGKALPQNILPLQQHILVLSGRACFELLHKALSMNIPVVVAVGAPSSLAIETALRFGQTLIGFTRDRRFNIYAGEERVG